MESGAIYSGNTFLKREMYLGGGENMFVSKKRWYALEKRLADLEKKVQNQPLEIISALQGYRNKQMSKSSFPRHQKK